MENQPETVALLAAEKRPDPEQICAVVELMQTMENRLSKTPSSRASRISALCH